MATNSIAFSCKLLVLFTAFRISLVTGFSCKDNNNKDVNWFIVYKMPNTVNRNESDEPGSGKKYFYMDSEEKSWTLQNKPIDDEKSALNFTVQQLYGEHVHRDDVSYLLYNDHTPDGKSNSYRGHAKGTILFNDTSGFWMVHSLPGFPNAPPSPNYWPPNGYRNGQTFLCVTCDGDVLETIRYQIDFYKPQIYSKKVKNDLKGKRDQASISIQPIIPCSNCTIKHDDIESNQIINIAKTGKSKEEIYAYVADRLNLNGLYVEAWRNGAGGRLPSCYGNTSRTAGKTYKVENIMNMIFTDAKTSDIYMFRTTQDHSKWAVSQDRIKPWVCIGDLNRFLSQAKRGGGVVCIQDIVVWQQFNNTIHKYEEVIMDKDHKCNRTVQILDNER